MTMYDLLIKNGIIIDGTGEKRYQADIGIEGGKIVYIGNDYDQTAKEIIEAEGFLITPGFIDCHSHSDVALLVETRARNKLLQGITTEITGNCGDSVLTSTDGFFEEIKPYIYDEQYQALLNIPWNAKDVIHYIEQSSLGTNIAFLAGHGTIRENVMGNGNRPPSNVEMEQMKSLVREAMEAGALGMSTGLLYPPGVYAKEDELVELSKVVGEYNGFYASHIRDEGNYVINSVQEAISIGQKAQLPILISHHKIAGRQNWGKSEETLKLIEEANQSGIKVRLDQYPYIASCTGLSSTLPPKYEADGLDSLMKRLKDQAIRQEIKQLIIKNDGDFENMIVSNGFEGILIVVAPKTKEVCGKTIAQIAAETNQDPYEVIFDLLVENNGNVTAVYFEMDDIDIERIMAYHYTMGGSDGGSMIDEMPVEHPRVTGTFIRIISDYIRSRKIVPLEEGIRKLTSMPAEFAGFKTKGIIKVGYDADLVILDYENLKDHADFTNPGTPNQGVKYVLVNGRIAVKNDQITGICAGKIIRHQN
ncbi:D-aminoacylase [Tissierella praeacuta]|uniref:N-acyl-D-amino-acid deacylase family protein n=1 Tax=Tissierella praeacuta TaxID=43131 RepID=UPI00334245BB